MKSTKKLLSMILIVCIVLTMIPLTASAGDPAIPDSVGTNGQYATMVAALASAADGTTITLLNDITESVTYTVSSDKTITIDGQGHKITGTTISTTVNDEGTPIVIQSSFALMLNGGGQIHLKDITLQAGPAAGSNSNSTGLFVVDVVNVESYGVVNAYGGIANDSFGLFTFSTGTVNVTHATGVDCGVHNELAGTVNVATATGTGDGSEGVYNSDSGTVNVTDATGIRYGVYNDSNSTGTINVYATSGTGADSIGASNQFKGTININTATGVLNSLFNANASGSVNALTANGNISNSGTMNVSVLTSGVISGSGTVKQGSDTQILPLTIDLGSSCVLSSIVVASGSGIDTTIGTLPSVYKKGIKGSWYTDIAKTTLFNGSTVTAASTLYGGLPNAVISIASVPGVTAPAVGAVTVSEITATDEYTGTVVWSPAATTFAGGVAYTANITLTPKDGYTLTGVNANFFKVTGATTTNAAGDGLISAVFPATPVPVASITKDSTTTNYFTLTAAMNAANDGDTVKMLGDVWEEVVYTVSADTTITMDGDFHHVYGPVEETSIPLTIQGEGHIYLKNVTLQGATWDGEVTVLINSYGIYMTAECTAVVESIGEVKAVGGGGTWDNSYGVRNMGSGTISITTAEAGNGRGGKTIGVANEGTGTVNVASAISGDSTTSYGVFNYGTGIVNVYEAKSDGGSDSYGVANSSGTVNVTRAAGGDFGAAAIGSGWINADEIKGGLVGQVITGSDIVTLVLHGGTDADCVLDSITVAKTGPTTIGILPSAIKNGVVGVWYTDSAKTQAFNSTTVDGITALYSTFSNTVTFDKNGGNTQAHPLEKTGFSNGTIGNLPAAPTKAGYTFSGWNTAANGSGTAFTAITTVTSNITVYAQWTLISNNNGGGSTGGSTGGTTTVITPPVDTLLDELLPEGAPIITETLPNGYSAGSFTSTIGAEAIAGQNGAVAAAVTEEQIKDAVKQATDAAAKKGEGTLSKIEIKVTAPAGSSSVETSIPLAAFNEVVNSRMNTLTVSTPLAALTFDADALSSISKEAKGDIKISVSKVEPSTLSEAIRKEIGDHPVFNFSVTSGNTTISEFGGNVAVTVPYTPKAGEDLDSIVIYYINAQGSLEIVSHCKYDPLTGSITFTTNHFSKFAVGYNRVVFKDVTTSAWYRKAVGFVAARGITTGSGEGKFNPLDTLNRGQFLVMAMKAYGIRPAQNPKDNFIDAGNTYYTGYLAAAKSLDIADGTGNNRFAPDSEITRQEMFALLYKILTLEGKLPTGTNGKTLANFSDVNQVESWAKDAMTWFVKSGVINGSGGKLMPAAITNRAQMAQVLYNLLAK